MIHSFLTPNEIVLGKGSVSKVREIIDKESFSKILILTDKGIVNAGLLPVITEQLENNVTYEVFDEVEPNPTDIIIDKAQELVDTFQPDCLIAVGGGSSIDTAKAVGILQKNGGKIIDYKGVDKVKKEITPIIAIPTTAGTGSEVTTTTVVNDTKEVIKYSIGGQNVVARWVIADPVLTVTLPAHITAATGLDALAHAIEAYTSNKAYPLTDVLATNAIKLIGENLRTAVFQGDNLEARQNMLEASLIAGMAFNNAKLGLCHVLCNPLGANFNIAHGVAVTVLLPTVTEFNLPAQVEKYGNIAELLGENVKDSSKLEAAKQALNAIKQLIKDIGLPVSLAELEVDERLLPTMVDECIDNPLVDINPRKASREDLLQIYRDSFNKQ